MIKIAGMKIRKLREEMGLTQEGLAKAVGLSSEFISLLELGKRAPSLESLTRIARFLKKDVSSFLVEGKGGFEALIENPDIGAKASRIIRKFQKYCSTYLELEEMTGRQSSLAPVYAPMAPERMARQERRRLNLGSAPARDVFALVEQNGLCPWRFPVPRELEISGIFVFLEREQAAFLLINSLQPVDLQGLTAAHGYAHYLRHRYDGPVVDNPDIFIEDYLTLYPGKERFAQAFAVDFLVPPSQLLEIIQRDIRPRRLNAEDVFYLKEYFGVSMLSMLQVLKRLDIISAGEFKAFQKLEKKTSFQALFSSSSRRWPKTLKTRPVLSERFISLVIDALRIKKISVEKAARLLYTKPDELSSFLKA